MNFLEAIFAQLKAMGATPVIQEIHPDRLETATGAQVLALVAQARDSVRRSGLKAGERCALLGPNSVRWIAVDLALMAEGIIVVPLYARQVASELVGMMKDCSPARLLCSDALLRDSITSIWPEAPTTALFDEIFLGAGVGGDASAPRPLAEDDAVTIIYTSGTSGEPKGVVLNARNVTFMIPRTDARLDELMALHPKQSRPD